MGYKKPSSNGILAIQIKKEDNDNIIISYNNQGIKSGYDFICTLKDFKAHNNILSNNSKNIIDTKYFLVAGNNTLIAIKQAIVINKPIAMNNNLLFFII